MSNLPGSGTGELGSDSISVIQEWGTPYIGFEPPSRTPHDLWWIWRISTSFHEGPRPPSSTRFGVGQR